MFCHGCGTQVDSNLPFCPNCGQALAPAAGVPVPQAPVVWTPPVGVKAMPGRWIGEGWEMVKADIGNYALVTLVMSVLSAPGITQGPLMAGFHIYCMKKLNNRNAELADLFKGFNYFIPTLVASLLIGLFAFAASLLCIIPGLVVAAMYKFTYLFIVDKRMDFWPAMQASQAVVANDYFGFTMFLLLMALVNMLGFLCCIVGVFISVPVTLAAITIAYKEIVGFEPQTVQAL